MASMFFKCPFPSYATQRNILNEGQGLHIARKFKTAAALYLSLHNILAEVAAMSSGSHKFKLWKRLAMQGKAPHWREFHNTGLPFIIYWRRYRVNLKNISYLFTSEGDAD